MRIMPDIKEFIRVTRELVRDAIFSPLRRYVLYSLVIHVVVIALLSVNMLWDAEAEATEQPATEKQAQVATPQPEPQPTDNMKPTGNKDDYYGREGIETATPDEIPKNPFDVEKSEDELESLEP